MNHKSYQFVDHELIEMRQNFTVKIAQTRNAILFKLLQQQVRDLMKCFRLWFIVSGKRNFSPVWLSRQSSSRLGLCRMNQNNFLHDEIDHSAYDDLEAGIKTNRKCSKLKNVVKVGSREQQIFWKHPAKKYSGPPIPKRSQEILVNEFTMFSDFMHQVISTSEESVVLQGKKSFLCVLSSFSKFQ